MTFRSKHRGAKHGRNLRPDRLYRGYDGLGSTDPRGPSRARSSSRIKRLCTMNDSNNLWTHEIEK